MNRIPKMSILLTILYTCRRSNGIPALHSISPVIGMEENAVSINQTSWKPAIGTPRINTHFMTVESARHPWCSDGENQRVRSHTVYVQGHSQYDKNVLCFIFRYKSVNSRSAIDRSEIGTYYVFNGHKMENVTTQKEKKNLWGFKKSHWEPAYFLDCMEMALHVIIRYFYLKYFKLNGASIKNVN